MRLILERFAYTPEFTLGTLWNPDDDKIPNAWTLELPWRENQRNISCIPEGEYPLRKRQFYRGGYDTYLIEKVPNRSYILFHAANWVAELQGCIAVGRSLSDNGGLLDSMDAVKGTIQANFVNGLVGYLEIRFDPNRFRGHQVQMVNQDRQPLTS